MGGVCYAHTRFRVLSEPRVSGRAAWSCVCASCLLLLLTWPLLFPCLTDTQYARAPPQSFIGFYCPLSQIQYASIDCVEMQSGSPQQRSKQSKFNKTPPPVLGPAPAAPPEQEQTYLCVWGKNRIPHVAAAIVRRRGAFEATRAECTGSDLSLDLTSCRVENCSASPRPNELLISAIADGFRLLST